MSVQTSAMRVLVACSACKRQYDATGFAVGSRFHCSCGETLTVPKVRPQDASVVRCSSCSAPRSADARSCRHCGADYTLLEQDMATICPACMTRVSGKARFCHHCATPIVPQGEVGTQTKHACPSCGIRHKMHSRSMGEPAIAMLECGRCAGIWLGREAFDLIAERARERARTDAPAKTMTIQSSPAEETARRSGSLYRKCPHCEKHMNRHNFGRRSGVVIDTCKDHGMWFDAQELDAILRWIHDGGETRAAGRKASEERHRERQQRMRIERDERTGGFSPQGTPRWGTSGGELGSGLLEGLLGSLFD